MPISYGHISDWNVSAVTNMAEAFMDRTDFNEDIGNWDVSNVTTMVRIFMKLPLSTKILVIGIFQV